MEGNFRERFILFIETLFSWLLVKSLSIGIGILLETFVFYVVVNELETDFSDEFVRTIGQAGSLVIPGVLGVSELCSLIISSTNLPTIPKNVRKVLVITQVGVLLVIYGLFASLKIHPSTNTNILATINLYLISCIVLTTSGIKLLDMFEMPRGS